MVEQQHSKLMTRVRFPSPAPIISTHRRSTQGNNAMRLHTIVLLLVLALPNRTASALDAAKTNAITKGAATFVGLAADSANTGRPPRESDAAVKPILDLVLDTSELKNGPAQPRSALDNLNA